MRSLVRDNTIYKIEDCRVVFRIYYVKEDGSLADFLLDKQHGITPVICIKSKRQLLCTILKLRIRQLSRKLLRAYFEIRTEIVFLLAKNELHKLSFVKVFNKKNDNKNVSCCAYFNGVSYCNDKYAFINQKLNVSITKNPTSKFCICISKTDQDSNIPRPYYMCMFWASFANLKKILFL